MKKKSIKDQFKENAIALLSLVFAVVALFYNTWRAELTEENFNIRPAAFETLKNLGQLQLLINDIRYVNRSSTKVDNLPIMGWGYVTLISDLSQILPKPIPQKMGRLVTVWQENYDKIAHDEKAADKVTEVIDSSRTLIISELRDLK